MKRLTAFSVCIVLFLLLCGCGKQTAVPLQCGSLAFSAGEYAYLLHRELQEAGIDAEREEVLRRTEDVCRYCAALETMMQTEGIRLSAPHKSAAAARTRGEWQFFSAHYRAIGMEKSDLTRLLTWEETEKALTEHLFGAGGKKEVKESNLQKWFNESYVGFRSFFEPLTKENAGGKTVPLSEAEQTALWETFREMKKRADSGTSLDSLYKEYNKSKGLLVTAGTEVQIIKQGDPTVTEDFFKAVQSLKTDETAVVLDGSRLVLLQRTDLLAPDTPYFAEARDQVLFEKKGAQTQKEVRALAETLETHANEQLCSQIYARVKAAG